MRPLGVRLRGLLERIGFGPLHLDDRPLGPSPKDHGKAGALGLAPHAPKTGGAGLLVSLSRVAGFNQQADLDRLDALIEASINHGRGPSGKDRSRDILSGIRALLTDAGVRHTPIKTPGNLPGIRIEPDPAGHALNRVAHDLKSELGVTLTYSPAELRAAGYRAAFCREELRLILPHAALRGQVIDPSAGHEIDHCRLFGAFCAGKTSLFFAELRTLPGGPELWRLPIGYDARFDFEELVTHARQLAALGRQLHQVESAPNPDLSRAAAIREEIATVAQPLNHVSEGLPGYLDRAAKAFEQGSFTVFRGELDGISALEVVVPTTFAELRFRTANLDILKMSDPQEIAQALGVQKKLALLQALAADLEPLMLAATFLDVRTSAEIERITAAPAARIEQAEAALAA